MILINNKRCVCGSDKIFRACMPSGIYCHNCGREVRNESCKTISRTKSEA